MFSYLEQVLHFQKKWCGHRDVQARIKEVCAELEKSGERLSVFVPGANDNRYIPMPGDEVTLEKSEHLALIRGRFEWTSNGLPVIKNKCGDTIVSQAHRIRAAK